MKDDIDKNKLVDNFSYFTSQEEKYLYLIELGKLLAAFPKNFYKKKYLVTGCQSQVWIKLKKNKDNTIKFLGDSDTLLVKGLISVIFILYKNMTPFDILSFDIMLWLKKISLTKYLTPSRSQGLEAVIKFIYIQTKNLID